VADVLVLRGELIQLTKTIVVDRRISEVNEGCFQLSEQVFVGLTLHADLLLKAVGDMLVSLSLLDGFLDLCPASISQNIFLLRLGFRILSNLF